MVGDGRPSSSGFQCQSPTDVESPPTAPEDFRAWLGRVHPEISCGPDRPIRAPRWVEVSDSQFAHEREGLAYLKEHLPNAAPYRVWTNFEFMDSQGRWHEVDALVLGQGRLHLVELKYYNGSLAGSESTWLRNGRRSERSPLLLARQKAQRLSSRIGDVLKEVARKTNTPIAEVNGWVPWIQECVFLHHPDLDVQLSGIADGGGSSRALIVRPWH